MSAFYNNNNNKNNNNKEDKNIKNWLLPEFGLLTHVHHTTQKKLKKNAIQSEKPPKMQSPEELDGFSKGYQSGLEEAKRETKQKSHALSELMVQITKSNNKLIEEVLEKIKKQGAEFIYAACQKILYDKLRMSPEIVQDLIHHALERVDNNSSSLKILCGKEIFDLLIKEQNLLKQQSSLSFEKDETQGDFGFRIESDSQCLEFNYQEALKKLIADYKLLC